MRKTIEIEKLKDYVNGILASPNGTPELRNGAYLVLDQALHEAGAYKGFSYLTNYDLPADQKPGVRYSTEDRYKILPYPERFADCDDTRRMYI